jgi:serine/threonine-protein kinase
MLPGGRGVLYTSHATTTNFDDANVVVQPLPAGLPKVVQRGGYHGRYLPSGHLTYVREGTLFAVPFDVDRLATTGQAVPILDGVAADPFGGFTIAGKAHVSVSETGTLVYVRGGQGVGEARSIVWMEQNGATTPLRPLASSWQDIRVSPDGRRLAMDVFEGSRSDVWVYDTTRDTLTRITFDGTGSNPIWTPDGGRIVFRLTGESGTGVGLGWRRADGTGDVQRLTDTSGGGQIPMSWNPDGTLLAFQQQNPSTGWDVMVLPVGGNEGSGWTPGSPTPILGARSWESEPAFSPDGRWLAYSFNESGQGEVYVRPFPGSGGQWLISNGGGRLPRWSRSRPELFYVAADDRIMVVPYGLDGDSFRAEKPQPWSERAITLSTGWSGGYDLHPDGTRFAVAELPETEAEDRLVFIVNFFEELRRLVPVN